MFFLDLQLLNTTLISSYYYIYNSWRAQIYHLFMLFIFSPITCLVPCSIVSYHFLLERMFGSSLKLIFKPFEFREVSWNLMFMLGILYIDNICLCVSEWNVCVLNYLAFQSFDFERPWWRLFRKCVVRTITASTPLLEDY
jgi:hypothetical protein